jgi:zona occludens toxin (predicted ATPase)
MPLKIVTIYCLCIDFLCTQGQKDDPKAQMTQAEVMTAALVAASVKGETFLINSCPIPFWDNLRIKSVASIRVSSIGVTVRVSDVTSMG